ncbi:MAG: hypothetical protein ACFBSD_03565 [Paracoccaceae bacterium]
MILETAIALLIGALAVEIAVRLPFAETLRRSLDTMAKTRRVLRGATISDHWKEKAMLAYSARMLGTSGRLAGMILAVILPAALFVWLADLAWPGVAAFVMGWIGLLATVVGAMAYLAVRRRFV